MATRASSKKEPSQKTKPKADLPAEKVATPQPATDLISPARKKSSTEARTSLRSGAPPISKAKQPTVTPVPAQAIEPVAETPPPKPESVSLIGETRSKRSESSGSETKIKSVLPPISKIRPPMVAKIPEPVVQPVRPILSEIVPAPVEEPTAPAGDEKIVHIKPPIIVRELAQQIGLKPFQLIHDLMDMNIFAAINHTIEPDVATAICKKHGYTFEVEKREKGGGVHTRPVVVAEPPPPVNQTKEELKPRAPIVTFMGHVDHGKTSLMDSIRKSRVAAGEAGGITQDIGAYGGVYKGQRITFIVIAGHEAFTAMRARGAKVTDVVVLVVAADDGIMPQTNEAINHARAAKVPMIVAINKVDLLSANVDRVKTQLQEKGLTPEDWGGETICVPVSATKGTGIDKLLEMILLQAEIMELKASPTAPARATVIEAQIEPGRGPTATIIVQMGTLKVGQPFICGSFWGKVKSLINDVGENVKEAGPATPVKVLGFTGLPNAGDELTAMESEKSVRTLSEERLVDLRNQKLAMPQRATLESLFDSMGDGRKSLLLSFKCDVQGSAEALAASLNQIESKKIELELIHIGVGPITESDVLLATASNAVIVGFNVKVENQAA